MFVERRVYKVVNQEHGYIFINAVTTIDRDVIEFRWVKQDGSLARDPETGGNSLIVARVERVVELVDPSSFEYLVQWGEKPFRCYSSDVVPLPPVNLDSSSSEENLLFAEGTSESESSASVDDPSIAPIPPIPSGVEHIDPVTDVEWLEAYTKMKELLHTPHMSFLLDILISVDLGWMPFKVMSGAPLGEDIPHNLPIDEIQQMAGRYLMKEGSVGAWYYRADGGGFGPNPSLHPPSAVTDGKAILLRDLHDTFLHFYKKFVWLVHYEALKRWIAAHSNCWTYRGDKSTRTFPSYTEWIQNGTIPEDASIPGSPFARGGGDIDRWLVQQREWRADLCEEGYLWEDTGFHSVHGAGPPPTEYISCEKLLERLPNWSWDHVPISQPRRVGTCVRSSRSTAAVNELWLMRFKALKAWVERNHGKMITKNAKNISENLTLVTWAERQRKFGRLRLAREQIMWESAMTDRASLLDTIPNWWWVVRDTERRRAFFARRDSDREPRAHTPTHERDDREWLLSYEAAKAWMAGHGDTMIKTTYKQTQEFCGGTRSAASLASWVRRQLEAGRDNLQDMVINDTNRAALLDGITGWSWDTRSSKEMYEMRNWLKQYVLLRQWMATHGGAMIKHKKGMDVDERRLVSWVSWQRRLGIREKLVKMEIQGSNAALLLEKLQGWTWPDHMSAEDAWLDNYELLKVYMTTGLRLRSSGVDVSKEESALYTWVDNQRTGRDGVSAQDKNKAISVMYEEIPGSGVFRSTNRADLLEAIPGWRWRFVGVTSLPGGGSTHAVGWLRRYEMLKAWMANHDNKVPTTTRPLPRAYAITPEEQLERQVAQFVKHMRQRDRAGENKLKTKMVEYEGREVSKAELLEALPGWTWSSDVGVVRAIRSIRSIEDRGTWLGSYYRAREWLMEHPTTDPKHYKGKTTLLTDAERIERLVAQWIVRQRTIRLDRHVPKTVLERTPDNRLVSRENLLSEVPRLNAMIFDRRRVNTSGYLPRSGHVSTVSHVATWMEWYNALTEWISDHDGMLPKSNLRGLTHEHKVERSLRAWLRRQRKRTGAEMEVMPDGRSVSRKELLAQFPESSLNPLLSKESEINMGLWLEAYYRAYEWIVGHTVLPRAFKKRVAERTHMDEDTRADRNAEGRVYDWLKRQRQQLEETGAIMHNMENGDVVSRKELVEGLHAMVVHDESSYDDSSSYDDESSSYDESSSSYEEEDWSSSDEDGPPSKRLREKYACSIFHLLLT